MFNDNEHYEHNCKCSKCKSKKEHKYFKYIESSDHDHFESDDWKGKKHKDHKWHEHHESEEWKHRKHKDHKYHDRHESDDWKQKKHKDHKYHDHHESNDWKHKKHKDNKYHDHHESDDWKHKKHKGHKYYDHHERDDWKHKNHKDHKCHDHHESDDWKYKYKDDKWYPYYESSSLEKHKHTEDSCVCSKVREINKAQKEVTGKKNGCTTSCERSIKELLSKCKESDLDTIPFKLLCGCIGECETFVGTGVVNINGCFFDIRSSFFRVADFVKGSDCCAILELLCPERCEGHHGISGFVRTGACFEVDLNDFTGITCFPPVAAKKMDPHRLLNGGYKKKS